MNQPNRILAYYQEQEGKSIVQIIKEKLLLDYLGKRNAKKRRVLLSYAKRFDWAITDRKLRRIYTAVLPIGYCRKGIYVIDDSNEAERMIRTIGKTVETLEGRKAMLKKHKQYLKFRDDGQGRLFR